MASSAVFLFPPNLSTPPSLSSRALLFSLFKTNTTFSSATSRTGITGRPIRFTVSTSASASATALEALIFDCDGVILESEHLHRQAYNDAFAHFSVRCISSSSPGPIDWSVEYYDVLQNLVGGGKPKMRWYFKENGWPTSTLFEAAPESDEDRAKLVDILQEWKTERYKAIIRSGTVKPRPGVLRLMDEAKASGKKLAVCSAGTKSSVVLCLENIIGMERFKSLDCFLAGDDVKEKKPDPLIYMTAAKKLGVSEKDCMVVEDSVIGLQSATGAGMSCVIYYTSSTATQIVRLGGIALGTLLLQLKCLS